MAVRRHTRGAIANEGVPGFELNAPLPDRAARLREIGSITREWLFFLLTRCHPISVFLLGGWFLFRSGPLQ
jgi:hypothetical protein